ncbi:MAG: tripartite tricarboxylate transporter TctB family protein [Pelagibacteraceae bacterium]|tara:strand:+ start:37 stop:474 length:438 start_codon:yes stop_codon:yes gene_type:complete
MFKITEELIFKILILTTFVVYFYLSLQFPSIPLQEGYGAGLFPIIISISFFLFAIKDFFTKNRQGFNVKENLVLLGFLIIIFIPMFFINFLGMYFTLGLFLFYLNFVLKIPLVKNTIITLSTIIIVHLVFVKIFKLSFPEIWFVE